MTSERKLVFGTAEVCDVRVLDPYVSPRHICATQLPSGSIIIEDLGSTNGTWLLRYGRAWMRVYRVQLLPGDKIQIGRTVIPW